MLLRVSKAPTVVPLITPASCRTVYCPRSLSHGGVKLSDVLRKKLCCFWLRSLLFHFTAIAPLSPTTYSAHVIDVTWHSTEGKLTWYTYWLKFGGGLWRVGRSSMPQGLWLANHQFTEAQGPKRPFPRSHKVTQQTRGWLHTQPGIFLSKLNVLHHCAILCFQNFNNPY